MRDPDFHHLAEHVIDAIHTQLEGQDPAGLLDLEPADGMLTIAVPGTARPWIVSRHSAAMEIWLSSPVSGGLHFKPAPDGWRVADGRELHAVLEAEVSAASGRAFTVAPA